MTETRDELQILNDVVHDLKTPLSAAKSFIELAEAIGPLNEKQSHFLSRARQSIARMDNMVRIVLDHARLGRGQALNPETCDLQELIDGDISILEGVALDRNVQFEVDIADDARYVYADPNLLQHAISNLLSNAIKYNRDDGTVLVQTRLVDDTLQISVQDTGIGIPADEQAYVWDSFYRVENKTHQKIEGTGLGLSIVKLVIEKHDGSVGLMSVEGEGTTFTISLPHSAEAVDNVD